MLERPERRFSSASRDGIVAIQLNQPPDDGPVVIERLD
jgi:hypothetical protein